jgi:molybdopterin-guanine dinucleotide biosynthesis protein A
MGRDKALLEVDGRAMAVRVSDALWRAGAAEVFCVGGDAALTSLGLRWVADDRPGEGPLGGLVTALRNAVHELVVVLACDLVHPSIEAIERLVDSAEDRERLAAATVPVVGNRAQWLHGAWWRDACLPPLRAAFDEGERSIHGAADRVDVRFVEDPGHGFADADTPEDVP